MERVDARLQPPKVRKTLIASVMKPLLPLLLGICTAASLHAAPIVNFDFTGTAPSDNTPFPASAVDTDATLDNGFSIGYSGSGTATGALTSPFTTGGTTPDDVFTAGIWNQNSVDGDSGTRGTLADAIVTDAYFGFTISPDAGFEFDLDGGSIQFDYSINSSNQARAVSVFTSVDGFAEANVLQTFTGQNGTPSTLTHTFSGAQYENVTGPLEVRFYLHDAQFNTSSGTRYSIMDNVVLDGTVSVIPEPGVAGLLLFGLATACLLQRHRRTSF